ncbi:MAG: DUF308 domain-containing protein [Candidatus Saccharibacteria bacterium]|nr:DUF308 domain-containing protein [Candidatus Saccharibacteria bacterium]
MSKKSKFDKIIKKIEKISSKVDIIMRNRLIVAFFLIVDGITFLLNPDTTLSEMARNIIFLILLAAFSVFITNLAAKTKDLKTITLSLIILILGIVFYIYPDFIAAYMQLLLALFIIYNGAVNIAKVLNLSDKLSKYVKIFKGKPKTKTKTKAKATRNAKFKEVDNSINEGLEQQKQKLVSPLKNIVNKSRKHSVLFIIANSASIILGIILLIFPDVSMMMWGLIFIYTGLPNFFAAMKSMNLFKKIKEKKFKEILYDDAEKNNKPKSKKR